MHHPVRRRKRRSHGVSSSASFSAIGVRSVEVARGSNGFGFTISGQQPCLLSCIVPRSPAEMAGLRPGHALVAVNGHSVAKLPHDTVVRLIGSCAGTLRLHVSENYYPHSSDSDIEDVDAYLPRRPAQGRAARVVHDLQSGAMFVEKRPVCSPPLQLPPRGVQNPPPPPPPSRIQPTDFKAIVGYLGTIELPKVLHPGSKLAVIRSCVKRMRAEKRIHTTVMLIVRKEQSVILADSLGTILAEFSAERVAFCGACADDKSFFGLVTSVPSLDDDDDDISAACGGSSCHVFMVDSAMHLHQAHMQRAAAFRVICTPSGEGCVEFPAQADPILRAVAALYNPAVSPPPPPPRSNTSSCHSSNSDSGIGFREEETTAQERLTVRAMPDPPLLVLQQQQQLKLSPKVFGVPVAQSLEDIGAVQVAAPSADEMSMSSLEHPCWGSLQDVRAMQGSPGQGRLHRRRKHATHHQHPTNMPPPPLIVRGAASLPSHTPQHSDDESEDCNVPFKRWCHASYLLNNPELTTPQFESRKLDLSSISQQEPSPPIPIPCTAQRLLEQFSFSADMSPVTGYVDPDILAMFDSPIISILKSQKRKYIETDLDETKLCSPQVCELHEAATLDTASVATEQHHVPEFIDNTCKSEVTCQGSVDPEVQGIDEKKLRPKFNTEFRETNLDDTVESCKQNDIEYDADVVLNDTSSDGNQEITMIENLDVSVTELVRAKFSELGNHFDSPEISVAAIKKTEKLIALQNGTKPELCSTKSMQNEDFEFMETAVERKVETSEAKIIRTSSTIDSDMKQIDREMDQALEGNVMNTSDLCHTENPGYFSGLNAVVNTTLQLAHCAAKMERLTAACERVSVKHHAEGGDIEPPCGGEPTLSAQREQNELTLPLQHRVDASGTQLEACKDAVLEPLQPVVASCIKPTVNIARVVALMPTSSPDSPCPLEMKSILTPTVQRIAIPQATNLPGLIMDTLSPEVPTLESKSINQGTTTENVLSSIKFDYIQNKTTTNISPKQKRKNIDYSNNVTTPRKSILDSKLLIRSAKKRLTPKIKPNLILKSIDYNINYSPETPHLEIKPILKRPISNYEENATETIANLNNFAQCEYLSGSMESVYSILSDDISLWTSCSDVSLSSQNSASSVTSDTVRKKVTFNLIHNDTFEAIPEENSLDLISDQSMIPSDCQIHNKDGNTDRGTTCRSHSEGGGACSSGETENRGPNTFDSFERLLDEPSGMHAFAEFLKKEFSHENIYFWVACEKYRRLADVSARKTQAKAIFQRHLGPGAPEPVNVDSQARQAAREGLDEARPDLFVAAQKQIFNLMKFDSYPRFLKCESREDVSPLVELDPDLLLHSGDEPNPGKLKKSRSDADERRRKSLLPWNRGKGTAPRTRSKSRDRAEGVHEVADSSSVRSELTGSRSSLASSDLALIQRGSSSRQSLSSGEVGNNEFCRVHLPDGATTVVTTQRGENIKQLICKLLEKRGLHFGSFELFHANSSKPLVMSEDSSTLGGQEVRVEQRVVFRLDLPSRKTVGVKAKAGRTLAEVLKPILHKYGYRLDNTIVTLVCDAEPLNPSMLINAVENQRLQATVTGPDGWKDKGSGGGSSKGSTTGATLDEITNRVFEELLQGKTDGSQQGALSDQGSVRSEDWSSEHSSGIFGRFLRRDSAFLDKTRESRSKGKKASSKHASLELDSKMLHHISASAAAASPNSAAAKAKWKLRPQAHGCSESDELYEGLKRAQRRMDDQRGTEINFELPDFLKDKENTPQSHRLKKGRLAEGECLPLLGTDGIDLSLTDGVLPSPGQADAYFASSRLRCSLADPPPPPQRHLNDPPPLPPKPKGLPVRPSKWNPAVPMSSASDDDSANNNRSTSFV